MNKLCLTLVWFAACPALAYQLEFSWFESHAVNCENLSDKLEDTVSFAEPDMSSFRKLLTVTVPANSTGTIHRYIETPTMKITVAGSITGNEKKYINTHLYLIELSDDEDLSITDNTTSLKKNKLFILRNEQTCVRSLSNLLDDQKTHIITTVKWID
ncbi:hypothetical protein [Zooshikella ganghwensis]|uniref:hypothetical protein n=1 Tax=Zooshikella ganghwensis TaxID=202772 RepID=UPI000424CECB|nr:hypothetical protein [Zooshikella ganghwensis]